MSVYIPPRAAKISHNRPGGPAKPKAAASTSGVPIALRKLQTPRVFFSVASVTSVISNRREDEALAPVRRAHS